MRCEVIAVGTELLLGQIVDTNSSWIAEQLALAGIDSHFQTKVGDNLQRIVQALQIALQRSDAVIMCGGLGPTQDDITREAIAAVMNVPLVRDEPLVERIREMFRSRHREMPDNNRRQADVPQGADVIPQMPGTAPGLICPLGDKVIYAVPGVPFEMQEMVSATIVPDLQRRAGATALIKSRTLRTWGQSESGLAEHLAERITELDSMGNPTLAFLASGIEGLKVRITAKGLDEMAVNRLLDAEERYIRGLLGSFVFGVDDQTMEQVVLDLLKEKGLTLGVAEFITGGLLATRLNATAQASDMFRGAIVCGADQKQSAKALGVTAKSLFSEAVVAELALASCRTLNSDVGLAATGIVEAGSATQEPPGTVFLGLAVQGETQVQRIRLPGRRPQMQQFSVISLLNFLRLRLLS
jgi:nicotinamide-nucleotide amidase